jgi:hypothetical protein
MKERIRYLERQGEEERDPRLRADTLLARLMDRMPELESPQEGPRRPRDGRGGAGGGRASARCPRHLGGRTEALVEENHRRLRREDARWTGWSWWN